MGEEERTARREAARQAVREARLEAERPWWQKRFFAWLTAVPRRVWRWWKDLFQDLAEGLFEAVLTLLAALLVLGVTVLVSWGWEAYPVVTSVLLAVFVAFFVLGTVETFGERRRGRLAQIAGSCFAFVAGWVALPLLPFAPSLLF